MLVEVNGYPAGIKDIKVAEGGIRVHPNPTTVRLILCLSGPPETGAQEVYNKLGAKVYTTTNRQLQSVSEIDISAQPAGVYFVTVQDGNKVYEGKVVKE